MSKVSSHLRALEDRIQATGERPSTFFRNLLHSLSISTAEKPSIDKVARIFLKIYGSDIRYHEREGRFMWWEGGRWHLGDKERPTGLYVRMSALSMFVQSLRQFSDIYSPETQPGQAQWIDLLSYNLGNPGYVDKVLLTISRQEGVSFTPRPLPPSQLIIRTPTGEHALLDMDTGLITPTKKEDIILSSTNIILPLGSLSDISLEEAKDSRFYESISYLMSDDSEKVMFMLRVLAYCMKGGNDEQVFFWLTGAPRNGKSIITDTLLWLLGEDEGQMSMTLDANAFTPNPSITSQYALGQIEGRRYIKVSEPSGLRFRLDEEMIKKVTGDATLRVREIYGKPKSVFTDAKVMFVGNGLPRIRDHSEAVNDRLILIKCQGKTITREDRDKTRLTHIRDFEQQKIFRLILEGYQSLQLNGLNIPADFLGTSKENKHATLLSDDVREFAEECLEYVDNLPMRQCASVSDIFKHYELFVRGERLRQTHRTRESFFLELEKLIPNMEKVRSNGIKIRNLRLKTVIDGQRFAEEVFLRLVHSQTHKEDDSNTIDTTEGENDSAVTLLKGDNPTRS